LANEFLMKFDLEVAGLCSCPDIVGFGSEAVCIEMLRAGPTWGKCATTALEKHDTPDLRAVVGCEIGQKKTRIACFAASSSCLRDERAACDSIPLEMECPNDVTLFEAFAEQCPNTIVLNR
jgi:hypothetical protein